MKGVCFACKKVVSLILSRLMWRRVLYEADSGILCEEYVSVYKLSVRGRVTERVRSTPFLNSS